MALPFAARHWRRRRAFARVGLAACIAGSACAPSQSFRPADVLGVAPDHELGLAVSSVGPRRYVNEPTRALAQAWWTAKLGERWSLSTLAAFDASAALGGVALRWDAWRTRWVAIASEAELGLFWAGVSLPIAVRLWSGGALYTSPRFSNWGPEPTFFAPLGLSLRLSKRLGMRAEVQMSWADFAYYNRRLHYGLGAAYFWP